MKTSVVETVAMVWNFLIRPGFRSRHDQRVRLKELPEPSSWVSKQVSASRELPVDVELEGPLVLVRNYDLPKSSPKRRTAILKYNALAFAERLGEDIFHAEALTFADKRGATQYAQALVRKTDVDTIKSWLEVQGLHLGRVMFKRDGRTYIFKDDRQVLTGATSLWWVAGFSISIALLSASWIEQKDVSSALASDLEALSQQSLDLQSKLAALNEENLVVSEEKQMHAAVAMRAHAGASLPTIFGHLTKAISSDAWIHQFEYSHAGVLIEGQTIQGVAELMNALRAEPWIASAELTRADGRGNADGSTPFSISLAVNWEELL